MNRHGNTDYFTSFSIFSICVNLRHLRISIFPSDYIQTVYIELVVNQN